MVSLFFLKRYDYINRSSRAQAGDGSPSSHPQFQTLAMLQEQYQDDSDIDSRYLAVD